MRRRLTPVALALCALTPLVAAPAAPAKARTSASKSPSITRVSPMRVRVGSTLTILGKNFSRSRRRNTVLFYGPGGRSAFAKPRRASSRKLVVTVPGSVERLLAGDARNRRPTRFKLRVLAGKFSRYTPSRLSPVIVSRSFTGGVGGGPPGSPGSLTAGCGTGSDPDGDLLSTSLEAQLKTDPCLRDTDLDAVEDGYEYQSAIDLNHYPGSAPLPYPGKRPYPNALDPGDAFTDYDDDGLNQYEEQLAWLRYSSDGVSRSGGRPSGLAPLLYSDGLQKSLDPAPDLPPAPLDAWVLDQNGDGKLWDDERDADGDGLGNWDEQTGRMTEAWWEGQHNGSNEPKESKYPELNFLDNRDLPLKDALADRDVDGDGVRDGDDDYDHDGLSNQFEVRRPDDWQTVFMTTNTWAYVQPFNPCKPYSSERCHAHPPNGYYDGDEVPPIGPNPPAGYPGSRPPTPNG